MALGWVCQHAQRQQGMALAFRETLPGPRVRRLILAHGFEAGNEVDVARSPNVRREHFVAPVRPLAADGERRQRAFGFPRGEVIRPACRRRVAQTHDGDSPQFLVARPVREIVHHALETRNRALVEPEQVVERGRAPDFREPQVGQRLPEPGVFEDWRFPPGFAGRARRRAPAGNLAVSTEMRGMVRHVPRRPFTSTDH